MGRHLALALSLVLPILLASSPAPAEGPPAGESIAWVEGLVPGMAAAKESGRILLVCVNARQVEGNAREEPAAKGLREVVYLDPLVVKRSRDFVCVFLTPGGGAADYGELRRLGVAGTIVSPQHIFIAPAGDRILLRREYWSHGKGEGAVKALLALMDQAEAAAKEKPAPAKDDPAAPPAPAEGEGRSLWIAGLLQTVVADPAGREKALAQLVAADRDGDCTGPVLALLPESRKDLPLLVALLRALGRPGLEAAAEPVAGFLTHRDDLVRGNAAVTLEYIGSAHRTVLTGLSKLAGDTKNESVANHACRALGRCGKGNAQVRTQLLTMAGSAKSEFGSYGPLIGLAHFEGDEKAARGVEKILKQIGLPGGRRGGGQNAVKRSVASWTLASIGDPKSVPFIGEELLKGLENMKAFWVEGLQRFWEAVARKCAGDQEAMAEVEGGVRGVVQFVRGFRGDDNPGEERHLMDDCRKGRESSGYKPRGDWLLEGQAE